MSDPFDRHTIKDAVRDRYAGAARRQLERDGGTATAEVIPLVEATEADACCGPASAASDGACCPPETVSSEQLSAVKAFYQAAATDGLPASVTDVALGCGNPTAIAELRPGETVVDLGSGGGIDCFLAAKQVGPSGRVIGVDMTEEMLALARANAAKVGVTNVEFRRGEIEALPLDDATADVIISNCVINLSTDKPQVLREAFRVLKPGGRFRVSDIVLTRTLSAEEAESLAEWAGCVAGALHRDEFVAGLEAAGFAEVQLALQEAWRDGVHSADIVARKPA